MSEPSGDQPDSKPPSAPAKPSPEAPGNNLSVAPRANPPSVFNQKPAAPAGTPPGMAEFMEWIKALGSAPAEEETRAGRTLIPKEQKKFSRQSAEAIKAPPSPAGATPALREEPEGGMAAPPDVGMPTAPVPPPPRAASAESFSVERKRRSKDQAPKSTVAVLLPQLFLFTLLVGSFLLGRVTVSRPAFAPAPVGATNPSASKEPEALPPELAAKVEAANVAQKSGDYQRARSLLEQVQGAGGRVYGLTFHLAELAYAARDWPGVLPLLNASIAKGEKVAESYNLRGTLLNQRDGPGKGLSDLQLAARLDPFNAGYAFVVGEAQRRMGKPQAAEGSLREALDRVDDPTQESFYELKLRLAQIEAGHGEQFAGELAAKLALNPPPLDWLFTAAAVELHRGNLSAAADALEKAKAEAAPGEMEVRLRDYYFYSFAGDKPLEKFFQANVKPVLPAAAAVSPTPGAAETLEIPTPGPTPKSP